MHPAGDRFEHNNALLLAACSAGDAAPPIPSGPFDWRYLVRAAETQGVSPLLHDWLTRHPGVAVDAACASQLQDAYWATHLRNKLMLAELDRLSAAAGEAGIRLMPLKGARLATDMYATPALRPLSDIDLLVRPHDLDGLAEVFRALGYRPQTPPPSYLASDRLDPGSREYGWIISIRGLDLLVEVRTQPLELALGRLTDFDRALSAALRAHGEEVWDRASGTPLASMSVEDMVLHVATHFAAKHVDFRLIWLHDLARLVMAAPSCDWDYIWATSTRLRVAAAVAAALDAASRWIGAPLSREHVNDQRARLSGAGVPWSVRWEYRLLSAHVDSLGQRDLTRTGPAWWHFGASLSRIHGWGARLRVLRWVALPSREYLTYHGHTPAEGLAGYVAAWSSRIIRAISADTKSAVASKSPDTSA